jgi:hypothetical protein
MRWLSRFFPHRGWYYLLPLLLLALSSQAAQYNVTNSNDSGAGSLRDALGQANGNAGLDTVFIQALPAPITITSATLSITSPVILEGNGATLTTAAAFDLLQLNAGSGGSLIRNAAFLRTGNSGSLIQISSNGNTVTSCRVGTDWANTAGAELGHGIRITGSGNRIGGNRNLGQHNVVSGNDYGVFVDSTGYGNTICGNICGLSSDQTTVNHNQGGVVLYGSGNTVGLPQPGMGNICNGNQSYGIQVYSGQNNIMQNNLVGINEAGVVQPNYSGIYLAGQHNFVGGARNASRYERNIITGNTLSQVVLAENGTIISGNYLNTNLAGTAGIVAAGENRAMEIGGGSNNLIGGSEGDPNNLRGNVVYDQYYGIYGAGNNNLVFGNRFGVLENGTIPAPQMSTGVEFYSGTGGRIGMKGDQNYSNLIVGSSSGVYLVGGQTGVFANTICAFSYKGIYLNGGNGGHAAPVVTWACPNAVSGTAATGDYIEVFRAEHHAGNGGSLAYLGSATASAGTWSVTVTSGLSLGDYVVATASDATENTSEFSINRAVTVAPPTPTSTATPTATTSPTPGPSSTITLTSTATPVLTATPTITRTPAGNGDLTGGSAVRAYPNPAKEQIRFSLNLDQASEVKINLYNLNGERVAGLQDTLSGQGATLTWACKSVGAGIYLARVSVNGKEVAKLKVAVLK